MSKFKILITGATGFIGSSVAREFERLGHEIVKISRTNRLNKSICKEICADTDWSDVLPNIDIIVHCAALVHQFKESKHSTNYQRVNTDGTLNLANQAKFSVKRFIFISSVKVNGEETFNKRFLPDDHPNPTDEYSLSKAIAEEGLKRIADSSNMEVVIIRPPMVYGPNVKGNMATLVNAIRKRLPLPLKLINYNLRSLIFLGNLVDFITLCVFHPAAKNETFLISDDADLSTLDIIKLIGESINEPARLIPVPKIWLKMVFLFVGRQDQWRRISGDLRVDISKNKKILGWEPKYSVNQGFELSFKKIKTQT